MRRSFIALATVFFRHTAYAVRQLKGVQTIPTEQTAKRLASRSMRVKKLPNGMALAAPINEDSGEALTLSASSPLSFHFLVYMDADVQTLTKPANQALHQVYYLSNTHDASLDEFRSLSSGPEASEADQVRFTDQSSIHLTGTSEEDTVTITATDESGLNVLQQEVVVTEGVYQFVWYLDQSVAEGVYTLQHGSESARIFVCKNATRKNIPVAVVAISTHHAGIPIESRLFDEGSGLPTPRTFAAVFPTISTYWRIVLLLSDTQAETYEYTVEMPEPPANSPYSAVTFAAIEAPQDWQDAYGPENVRVFESNNTIPTIMDQPLTQVTLVRALIGDATGEPVVTNFPNPLRINTSSVANGTSTIYYSI